MIRSVSLTQPIVTRPSREQASTCLLGGGVEVLPPLHLRKAPGVLLPRGSYNPDVNDWFFTKHLPSGRLDRAPTGMALEGRLPGCTNCHRAMQTNDYLFTSQLGGVH